MIWAVWRSLMVGLAMPEAEGGEDAQWSPFGVEGCLAHAIARQHYMMRHQFPTSEKLPVFVE